MMRVSSAWSATMVACWFTLSAASSLSASGTWHVTGPGETLSFEHEGALYVLGEQTAIEVPAQGVPRLNFGTVEVRCEGRSARLGTIGGELRFQDAVGTVFSPVGLRVADVKLQQGTAKSSLCYQTTLTAGRGVWRLGCPPQLLAAATRGRE